jgi:hypothetical protein
LCLDLASPAGEDRVSFINQHWAISNMGLLPYLLENNLPGISCDGEPAPDRFVADILFKLGNPDDRPNGDLTLLADVGSIGDVLLVGDVDRPGPLLACGGYPIVRWSPDREDDIIDYSFRCYIKEIYC